MKERIKKILGKKPFIVVLLIGLIISITVPPVVNKIDENKLDKNGIITYGQIIGIWQLSEQHSMAIFMFPIDDKIYHTGRFGFPRGYNVNKGDRVQVIYLENRPNVNRAVEVLAN